MIRPADSVERTIFTLDSKGLVFIGQVWVRTQIKSKPNARPTSLQQTEMKVTLYSLVKTRGVHSCST